LPKIAKRIAANTRLPMASGLTRPMSGSCAMNQAATACHACWFGQTIPEMPDLPASPGE